MERRDIARRAELVRWVVEEVVQNPGAQLTASALANWLHVSADVAQRILDHLVDAGLVREVHHGVWARTSDYMG